MKIDQPTAAPTAKVMAAIIAGVIVSIVQTIAVIYAPDFLTPEMEAQVASWVTFAVMAGAAYWTRERV